MRPIKLEIEGLNSFESNQILDFDSLGNGVFGIFGNTGSGKSTILDAITLALYGKIERSKQNIDFINIKRQKAVVKLIFEINQNGRNKNYLIERCFSKKKTGKMIDSSAALYEIESDEQRLVEEGTIKVNDRIFSIIGLGVNEFAKCIALPQGEFSAFLQAKPSERIEIMSNIFNLDKYGEKLSQNVKERLNESDKELSILTANKQLLSQATDEAVEEIKKITSESKEKYEKVSKELETKLEELSKAQKAIEQQENLNKINEELNALEKEKPQIENLRQKTQKSQNANEIKSDFLKLKRTQIDEKELSEKIASLNEFRIQKQTAMQNIETQFNELRDVYETKVIELNKKITVLEELESSDDEIKKLKEEQETLKVQIQEQQKLLASEQENLAYIDSLVVNLQNEILKLDNFIYENKPKVEKCYAIEQLKNVESEFILIEDFYEKIETMIDDVSGQLKNSQIEYNEAIKKEKELKKKQESIKNSLRIVFDEEQSDPIEKLRGCDKKLLEIADAENLIEYLKQSIERLKEENNERLDIIAELKIKIEKANKSLFDYNEIIDEKSNEIQELSDTRESLLGENVISLIADNLRIGDYCPVCSSRVIQKIYSEKNDLFEVENNISSQKQNHKNLLENKDKLIAELVSLKSRLEFEKSQIEANDIEITQLNHDISRIYQKFVDDNEYQKENFKNFKSLVFDASKKLEELILMQEKLRDEELSIIISKSQYGTNIVDLKNVLESLYEILYDLQKKKAERELIILNSNSEMSQIEDYKKFIADGKSLEIEVDEHIKKKQQLKDEEFKLMQDKSASERKILEIKSTIQILAQKIDSDEKHISNLVSKTLTSGVPEGVSVVEEKEFTKESLTKLKKEYLEKQSLLETSKEEFSRIENDYKINVSILKEKQNEMQNLKNLIEHNMVKFNFSSNEEIEENFAENVEIKQNIEKINNFDNKLFILNTQKNDIINNLVEGFDEIKLNLLKEEVSTLNEETKTLSEEVGKNTAKMESLAFDNLKLKELEKSIVLAQNKYDTAKELSSVLRGRALAEYFCEEYLQDITENANRKLELLLDGRYTLRFENKEFFVEDNFSDGVLRSASTLSGGETFIVSLSLALSISDAIAMLSSRSIDFFFLDEGFGTLDSELCSVVISALHKLESQNLRIGLISHIAELAEAIKNKVIITKEANGSKIKIEHSL